LIAKFITFAYNSVTDTCSSLNNYHQQIRS